MDAHLISGLGIILVKSGIKSLHIIVKAGPGDTLDSHDADSVLVTHLDCGVDVKSGVFGRERHLTHLNVPESGEFLPHHLITGRDYEIRFVIGLSGFLATLYPTFPGRDATEHTSLRRADRQSTRLPFISFGSVPEISHYIDTFLTHHSHTWIFSLINVIHVDILVHQFRGPWIHICGHECGKIKTRLGLGECLVLHHLVGHLRSGGAVRNLLNGSNFQHSILSKSLTFGITEAIHRVFHNYKF